MWQHSFKDELVKIASKMGVGDYLAKKILGTSLKTAQGMDLGLLSGKLKNAKNIPSNEMNTFTKMLRRGDARLNSIGRPTPIKGRPQLIKKDPGNVYNLRG